MCAQCTQNDMTENSPPAPKKAKVVDETATEESTTNAPVSCSVYTVMYYMHVHTPVNVLLCVVIAMCVYVHVLVFNMFMGLGLFVTDMYFMTHFQCSVKLHVNRPCFVC